jgi:UDP-N-acetyl-D-glucosamine dehydrogenase
MSTHGRIRTDATVTSQAADHPNQLLEKTASQSALVGVIDVGYLGLPLALAFVDKGFRVLGFAVDADKVARLERGIAAS